MLHIFYKTLAVVILLLLFIIAVGGVSHKDKWRIDRIDIAGANTVSADRVRALVKEKLLGNYFFVYARENSFLFPRREIEHTLLDTFPRLSEASALRGDVSTIEITVSERKPYVLWCGAEFHSELSDPADCWFVDDSGFVFDRAPVFSEGVYIKMYGPLIEKTVGDPLRSIISSARFSTVDTFAKLSRADIGEPIRVEMKEGGENELMIRASETHPFLAGVSLRFNDEQDPATLINNLRASIPVQFPNNVALKKKLLYIDMRFGSKIFFGFGE